MIPEFPIVRDAATRIGGAVERVSQALRDGRVEQEPAFTDRMLGAIEETMHEHRANGVVWTAKTLTDRGPGAQESRHGADFAGVLSVRLPNFEVDKGFLGQAKLVRQGQAIRKPEFERLQEQCEQMLHQTPDSFVFLYSPSGVRIVPAIAIASSGFRSLGEFYSRSIFRFYEEHFSSFIGDRRLNTPNPTMLDALLSDWHPHKVLYLKAHADEL